MIEHKNHHLFVLAEASMSNREQLDRKVQQLIQQALQHSFGTQERTHTVISLISLGEQLPGSLNEDKVDKNLRPFYNQAFTQMEEGMSRNIDRFPNLYDLDIVNTEPSVLRECFVRWYNLILKRKLIDLSRVKRNKPPVSLDEPLGEDGETTKGENIGDTNILPPIEQAIFEENQRQQQLLLDYLRQDPDQILHNCCSQKYPHCNCWEICKMRLQQPPKKWEDIPKALNVPYGTLTPHWYRKCLPLLKEIAKKFGLNAE